MTAVKNTDIMCINRKNYGNTFRLNIKMSKNTLQEARKKKFDEFYTQLCDIEKELYHYRKHFKNKVVFCNCDDPYESNFFKYFALNFNILGLKKLIATCYQSSPYSNTELQLTKKKAYKIDISNVPDTNGDGAYDLSDVSALLMQSNTNVLTELEGDGDFRSAECVKLLDEADIIVTNPPFSLFREYVALLVEHKKKFLILGNQNAITYKEIFPLLKNNEIWLGIHSGSQTFRVPDCFEKDNTYINDGIKYAKFGNICWFTNLDNSKRHEKLVLYKKYNKSEFPKYDNYDAINVNRVADIPYDYNGIMGVPITFLDKYNPEQFEILGLDDHRVDWRGHGPDLNGKSLYRRIIIKKIQK